MFTQTRTYENAFYFFGSDQGKKDRAEKMEVNYSTFGATLPGRNANSNDYRYGMNTQEKDPEIAEGVYTAKFWEYDSRLGRRWNRDPKPNPSISVYAAFGNNPVRCSDIEGDTIRFKAGTSAEFQQQYMAMVSYLRAHNAAQIIDEMEASTEIIYVADVRYDNPAGQAGTYFYPDDQTIYWNPYQLSWTNNGTLVSATVIFAHEADHAMEYITDPVQFEKDRGAEDPQYGKVIERKAIMGTEQIVARKLGEIGPFDVTRTDHGGQYYPSYGATSTEINEDAIPASNAPVTGGPAPQDTTRTPAQAEQDPYPDQQPDQQEEPK